MHNILIADDNADITQVLAAYTTKEGYNPVIAADGEEALRLFDETSPSAVLLDVMMPKIDGYEVCRALRKDGNKTPILMLTARDAERDIVEGLDTGADDYLAKPFSFDVLLARIRALLRRPNEKLEEILQVGDLKLDPSLKKVTRASQEITLTAKEYGVLEYLMRNKGKVLSKEQIISHV